MIRPQYSFTHAALSIGRLFSIHYRLRYERERAPISRGNDTPSDDNACQLRGKVIERSSAFARNAPTYFACSSSRTNVRRIGRDSPFIETAHAYRRTDYAIQGYGGASVNSKVVRVKASRSAREATDLEHRGNLFRSIDRSVIEEELVTRRLGTSYDYSLTMRVLRV